MNHIKENKIKFLTKVPKRIKIEEKESSGKTNCFYAKELRNKEDWSSLVEIKRNFNDEKKITVTMYIAYDKGMISLIKKGKMYKRQKIKKNDFTISSKELYLSIDSPANKFDFAKENINITVLEYFTRIRLDAIVIKVDSLCNSEEEFEILVDSIQYLFKINKEIIAA